MAIILTKNYHSDEDHNVAKQIPVRLLRLCNCLLEIPQTTNCLIRIVKVREIVTEYYNTKLQLFRETIINLILSEKSLLILYKTELLSNLPKITMLWISF